MSTTRKRNTAAKKKEVRSAKRRSSQPILPIPLIAGLAVLALLVIVALVVTSNQGEGARASGPIEGLKTFPNQEAGHTTGPVTYNVIPPTGGRHHPSWLNCGVYTEPVANENAVHSLEHGAIWITYQPDLPAEQVEQLREITRQSGYRLLSPFPDLPAPIVASAWGYQIQLEQADDPRLLQFIRRYEQNPEGPEPGAPCTGGVGTPG